MFSLVFLLMPIALVIFWGWMFWEMTNNESLPRCYITLTNGTNARYDWTIAFILLSIFTAVGPAEIHFRCSPEVTLVKSKGFPLGYAPVSNIESNGMVMNGTSLSTISFSPINLAIDFCFYLIVVFGTFYIAQVAKLVH